jgi:hypothetical protein
VDQQQLNAHPDAQFLTQLKYTCRQLILDGPNCAISCLPDNTVLIAQDRKKLRPDVVGGVPGNFGFASEVCGLDAAIPEKSKGDILYSSAYSSDCIVLGGPNEHGFRLRPGQSSNCSLSYPLK